MGDKDICQFVPYHKFIHKSGAARQVVKRGALHSLWKRISSPFLLPSSVCSHEWKPYDADLAGCVLCGAGHECNDGGCQTEQNGEVSSQPGIFIGCVPVLRKTIHSAFFKN